MEPTEVVERPDGAVLDDEDEHDTVRFNDPYWEDAFCAWLDPTMGTCCG